jgi:hypothetical protein
MSSDLANTLWLVLSLAGFGLGMYNWRLHRANRLLWAGLVKVLCNVITVERVSGERRPLDVTDLTGRRS